MHYKLNAMFIQGYHDLLFAGVSLLLPRVQCRYSILKNFSITVLYMFPKTCFHLLLQRTLPWASKKEQLVDAYFW